MPMLSDEQKQHARNIAVGLSGAAHLAAGLGKSLIASIPAAYMNAALVGVGGLTLLVAYEMYQKKKG